MNPDCCAAPAQNSFPPNANVRCALLLFAHIRINKSYRQLARCSPVCVAVLRDACSGTCTYRTHNACRRKCVALLLPFHGWRDAQHELRGENNVIRLLARCTECRMLVLESTTLSRPHVPTIKLMNFIQLSGIVVCV